MAAAIEEAIPLATQSEVGAWVQELARDTLAERAKRVAAIERISMLDELEVSPSASVPSVRPPTPSTIDATTIVLSRPPPAKKKRR